MFSSEVLLQVRFIWAAATHGLLTGLEHPGGSFSDRQLMLDVGWYFGRGYPPEYPKVASLPAQQMTARFQEWVFYEGGSRSS